MTSRANALLAVAAAAPLVYAYMLFLSWVISNHILPSASYIEDLIVVSQLFRVALILSVGRLRRASPVLLLDIFSLEIFTFPVLTALYFLFGGHYLITLTLTIAGAWPSALLCVVPPLVIYKLALNMANDRRLMSVLPPAVALFALLAFVTRSVSSQPAPSGLTGLSSFLLSTLLKTRSIDVTPLVVLAGIPLYLSLATYAATQGTGPFQGKNGALLLVVLGTLVAIGFVALADFAGFIALYPTLPFVVPGTILVTMMWWITRAALG